MQSQSQQQNTDDWDYINETDMNTSTAVNKIEDIMKSVSLAWLTDNTKARSGFYNFLDNLTIILSNHLRAEEGEYSWLDNFKYMDGSEPSAQEKRLIRDALETQSDMLNVLRPDSTEQEQKGGMKMPTKLDLKAKGSQLLQSANPTSFDISLDRGFTKLMKYIDSIDEQVSTLTSDMGPTAFISSMHTDPIIPLPYPPGMTVKIPKNIILPFISLILEMIKMFVVLGPGDNSFVRKLVSLTQAVYEFSNGNWRQAILSFIGFFSKTAGAAATFGKFILNAWLFIDPSLRTKMQLYVFRGAKSMVVSFFIWLFHIFAPDMLWIPITRFIDNLNELIQNGNEQAEGLGEKLSQYVQTMGYEGYTVKLPTIDEIITDEKGASVKLSYDDLQNVQRLLSQPIIFCSKEGQELLQPILQTPARIILELIGIPTVPDMLQEECGISSPEMMKGLSELIAETVVEKTNIIPPSAQAL